MTARVLAPERVPELAKRAHDIYWGSAGEPIVSWEDETSHEQRDWVHVVQEIARELLSSTRARRRLTEPAEEAA